MAAPPYQKLFWGSYHKHTAHLSHAREHGAYLLLIGALWNNDGRLPADDDTLAAYAKLSAKEWAAMKPKLLRPGLLRISRGRLVQDRVTEDLAKYRDTSGKRKEAGKAGGQASARKHSGNSAAIAADLPTKPEPESEPDREVDKPTSLRTGKPVSERASRKRGRETPIPDGFPGVVEQALAGAWVAAAAVKLDVVGQARRFRDHAATNDRRVRDWAAAWRQWIGIACEDAPAATGETAAVVAAPWAGPSEVWTATADAAARQGRDGEAFARSWITPCGWVDLPVRALICPNRMTLDRLRAVVGPRLRDMGIELQERAA